MSGCREVISLQFGHYANFVGAHFWNIQELSFDYTGKKVSDVNHDVLYREGVTSGGKTTYTPRLLLAELRGGLGSLPTTGGLDQPVTAETVCDDAAEWTSVERTQEPPIAKNEYLRYINNEVTDEADITNFDFETNVTTWTDYLFPRFHPRTISLVNEYKHNDSEVPFEIFHSGSNTWKTSDFSDDFTDNIRRYAEECDNCQGFQITLDATDGFAGLADECIQYLNDEYPSKSIHAVPLIASHFPDNNPQDDTQVDVSNRKDSTRMVNLALAMTSLFENTSLVVPMCCGESGWRKPGAKREFYNVNYNSELNYHSSAIIASALDTLSLGYRLKSDGFTLPDLCSDMTGYGRKIAAASLGLPLYMQQKQDLIEHLDTLKVPLWSSLTPRCQIGTEKVFQHLTVRGIPESRLKRPLKDADEQIKMAAYRCNGVKEMFEMFFQCNHYASVTHVSTSANGMQVKMPFPKLFGKDLNCDGFVKEFVDDDDIVESVPVIAGLHNGNFMYDTIKSMGVEAKRIKLGKLYKFKQEGLEQDDFTECLDKLNEFQDNYKDSYEL